MADLEFTTRSACLDPPRDLRDRLVGVTARSEKLESNLLDLMNITSHLSVDGPVTEVKRRVLTVNACAPSLASLHVRLAMTFAMQNKWHTQRLLQQTGTLPTSRYLSPKPRKNEGKV